jgi:NADH-quinone oxidoreductase subunit C/D
MSENSAPPLESTIPVPENLQRNVFITSFDKLIDTIYNWGRMYSTWPMLFGLACCAIEMICTASSRYDLERFGWGLMRASPRQADLMIVSGTVTKKMVPNIVRLYNQMPEPKYVLSMGACASGGGPFKEGYNVVSGIDRYIPVDVYVPGCPPTPTALLQGIVALQDKFKKQSFRTVRWYDREQLDEAIPVPVLGPDIFDPRDIPIIKEEREKMLAPEAEEEESEDEDAPKKRVKRVVRPPKVPSWKTDPTEEAQALADKINAALEVEAVTPENNTLVVDPDHLVAFATYLRDDPELDRSYLSNVTGVDYLERDPRFEVVYHAYSINKGGGPITFKARPKDNENPELPSLINVWASADLQEREIYDLFGIRFPGHPRLKRILMWEGFHGHPMRKDYEEAYYVEPVKPFTTRWPDGFHERAEFDNPYNKNVVYPPEFDPDTWVSPQEALAEVDTGQLDSFSTSLRTERIKVNMGPQHPSTHGVFRMVATLEGETIIDLEPVLGYLHRNHEKIGERNGWLMNMPYTDRLDYITSMSNNLGYALLVEKMADITVPERAEYIRVIMAELTRVVSHLWLVGFFLNDLGAFFTPALYAIKAREMVLDLFEEISGSRMMCNYMRFGGVVNDVSDDWLNRAAYLVREKLPHALDELETLLNQNEILLSRTKGVGYLSPERLISAGVTGPQLRASGVNYDIRKVEPYSIYDRFDFDIPTLPHSDVYDRYLIRLLEARQSLRILDQALDQIEPGEIMGARSSYTTRVPAGEAYSRIENPKGELGFYAVSNGSGNPWRYRVRAPCYINLTALPEMCRGQKVADTIIILGAIDIVLGEVDR